MPKVDPGSERSLRGAIRRLTRQIAARWKWRATRRRQLRRLRRKPRIITSRQLGLRFQYIWGGKGTVYRGAGHYTAGPRAKDAQALKATMRAVHQQHASQGWGGASYEAMIADDGTIGLLNPTDRKSAAVAGQNTGMVNLCIPASTGDRMTPAQKRSIAWLLANWDSRKIPAAHRLPKPARSLTWLGHREHPGQSTACPGELLTDYRDLWRTR